MWLGGCAALAAAVLLPATPAHLKPAVGALAGWTVVAAAFSYLVFPRCSERTLYLLNNLFSSLGALTVWAACFWSGGAASPLASLYFFPVLYDAYFFRLRHALPHLLVNSLLALSPLLYQGRNAQTRIAGLAVMVGVLCVTSALVGWGKRKLLAAELAARRQALTDPLTGVLNLRGLRARARSLPRAAAVVLVDLDNFKAHNTAHGHTGADRLLQQVAKELKAVERGCVARIGGDEFVVVARAADRDRAAALAGACARAVERAGSRLWGDRWPVQASVGYAYAPEDGTTLAELLRAADRGMYRQKRAAKLSPPQPAAQQRPEPADPTAAPPPAAGWRLLPSPQLGSAAAWLGSGLAVATVALLPSPFAIQRTPLLWLALGCATLGVCVPLGRGRLRPLLARLSDLLVAPALGTALYLSGGGRSPLLAVDLLAVAFAAQYGQTGWAVRRALLYTAVTATPFLYSTNHVRLAYAVPFIAVATTSAVLATILLYNRRRLAAARARALELARTDPLTRLPNRRAFQRLLADALALQPGGEAGGPVLAMIDLDNFKRVNDSRGHAAGDRLLQAIAAELSAVTRGCDCIARYGGDEFALLARNLDRADAEAVGRRAVAAVERAAAALGLVDCAVSATVGVAVATNGETRESLLERADLALMEAKEAGKRRVAFARAPAKPANGRRPATVASGGPLPRSLLSKLELGSP